MSCNNFDPIDNVKPYSYYTLKHVLNFHANLSNDVNKLSKKIYLLLFKIVNINNTVYIKYR